MLLFAILKLGLGFDVPEPPFLGLAQISALP
jgi:hypothetical protein